MSDEQALIDLINANAGAGDRLPEHVYADWLDDNGDPRAEGWRAMIQDGKMPFHRKTTGEDKWCWYRIWYEQTYYCSLIKELMWALPSAGKSRAGNVWRGNSYWDAMNALAIAWVRQNHGPDYVLSEPSRW